METIRKRPLDEPLNQSGKYEKFNLKENPFPSSPTINSESDDKRYNGDIFEVAIRENELNKILENFIKIPQSDPNHFRLGYILDTSYVGRGNGKSSFSIYLLKKINQQYCLNISEERNKCFGLYISPEPSGRTKSFLSLVDLIFNSILNSTVIEYSFATIRLESLISLYNFDYKKAFSSEDELIHYLNEKDWFEKNGFDVSEMARIYKKNKFLNLLPKEFPLESNIGSLFTFINTKENLKNYYLNDLRGNDRVNFLFNDLVNFLLGAGFNGAYIIVDDFERIPDFQSDRQKRDFALEIRTNFYDGFNQNAKIGFYNLFLMLHAGVPRLIGKAWSESGLEQRSPISVANINANHIILFEKLNKNYAILLIKKYLNEFRIKESNSLEPFNEESIVRIGELSEYNAAGILHKANGLLENAIKYNVDSVDINFVNKILFETQEIEESSDRDVQNVISKDLIKKARDQH